MVAQPARYHLLRLYVENGNIVCRYYPSTRTTAAVLWLGGSSGGFDSPAHGLYDKLAVDLQRRQTASLRIRYRVPNDLDASIDDALVGLEFLRQQGIERCVLVGYAFGGAVAIGAGAVTPEVLGVAVLACQSYGTGPVNRIAPRPLLLIAGEQDATLPLECSEYVYANALDPKQLVTLPAGHTFDEAASQLQTLLRDWIAETLPAGDDGHEAATGRTDATPTQSRA